MEKLQFEAAKRFFGELLQATLTRSSACFYNRFYLCNFDDSFCGAVFYSVQNSEYCPCFYCRFSGGSWLYRFPTVFFKKSFFNSDCEFNCHFSRHGWVLLDAVQFQHGRLQK